MRSGLFVLFFVLLVTGGLLGGVGSTFFVLYMSAVISAIGATVMTSSGRQALRRIRHNLTQGWTLRSSE